MLVIPSSASRVDCYVTLFLKRETFIAALWQIIQFKSLMLISFAKQRGSKRTVKEAKHGPQLMRAITIQNSPLINLLHSLSRMRVSAGRDLWSVEIISFVRSIMS